MTVDVAAQGAALVQAVLLGLAAGVLYDLFRILRVRVRLPLLGPALDLLFWLTLTVTLFLWSQWAWGAPVRGGVSVPGRGGLLRAVQPLAALAGVPAGRPDDRNS